MRPLSALDLLDIWERGWAGPPARQALMLLEAACPEADPDALADLTVGERDRRLLVLRAWTFGHRLVSLARCPACDQQLELSFSAGDLAPEPERQQDDALGLTLDGYEVRFRLPTGGDLLDVATEGAAGARLRLLERCLLAAHRGGEPVSAARLPAEVVDAVATCLAEADPGADLHLALTCPACSHAWQAAFDVVSFFWREIQAWATRTLYEVHALARAYGWSEAEVLATSPIRRQLYLDMVRA